MFYIYSSKYVLELIKYYSKFLKCSKNILDLLRTFEGQECHNQMDDGKNGC